MNPPSRARIILVAFVALFMAMVPVSASPPRNPQAERLAEASGLYEQATEARAAGQESSARSAFDHAAIIYEQLVAEHPDNPSLRRNLALAHINAGRVGYGIIEFRRARSLAASHPHLRAQINADLAVARSQVRTQIEPIASNEPLKIMQPLARPWLLWISLAIMALGWTIALCRFLIPKHAPGYLTTIATLVLGTLALSATLAGLWSIERSTRDRAVVIVDTTIARTGPSEAGFPPAFDQPLTQGVEVRVTDRRSTWVAATLSDDRQIWLPADAIEFIARHP